MIRVLSAANRRGQRGSYVTTLTVEEFELAMGRESNPPATEFLALDDTFQF